MIYKPSPAISRCHSVSVTLNRQ